MPFHFRALHSTLVMLLFVSLILPIAAQAEKSAVQLNEKQSQRDIYQRLQQAIDLENWTLYHALRPQLNDYPLTPYLDYRVFLRHISEKTPKQVDQFITQYRHFPFSARVSSAYLNALVKSEQWQRFLDYQTELPQTETYQCHYYSAQFYTGKRDAAFSGVSSLWMKGTSIAKACDRLLSAWNKAGLRTDELILQRMLLVFEKNNRTLLEYLSKQVTTEQASLQAKAMLKLFDTPSLIAQLVDKQPVNHFYQTQTELVLKRWARKDVVQAQQQWQKIVKAQQLSEKKQQHLAEFMANILLSEPFTILELTADKQVIEQQVASSHIVKNRELVQWRDSVIKKSQQEALLEKRIRLALQQQDWVNMPMWIELLDEKYRASSRWQYWLGRAEIMNGNPKQGKERLKKLLGSRDFYSVAAAQELQLPIQYPAKQIVLDMEVVKPYQAAFARIEELIQLDKIVAVKSEWRWLLVNSDLAQQQALAAYAAKQGWHHLTVMASISAKMKDEIHIRFPIAHRKWFNFYADKFDIDMITLLALARQESALDTNAQSPVGARGLMQIMPRTAQHTAKLFKIDYRSDNELYDADKNIEIGSQYLSSLLKQYDNNRIFAFAAYNAGPSRVDRWRKRSAGRLDAYAFIETIPFAETRGYVQNILMFETYYQQLMLKNDQSKLRFLKVSEAELLY